LRASFAPGLSELDHQRDHKYGPDRDWPHPTQDDAGNDPERRKCHQGEHLYPERLLGERPARPHVRERIQGAHVLEHKATLVEVRPKLDLRLARHGPQVTFETLAQATV
jgi:hypothetical protein